MACPACHPSREWNPAEALYAFAGELTTMPDQVVGRCSNAAPMADRLAAFISRHGLDSPRPGWENYIVPNKEV